MPGVFFAAIFLVALATLVFEISLIRVLSFTIWYHFAYVVISTALLGFGASGTLVALRPSIGTRDPARAVARCCAAAAASVALVLAFVAVFPLDPTLILRERSQLVLLFAYQLVAATPFFFSGIAISLMLRGAGPQVGRLYFFDLVGAGLGSAAAVALMNALTPPGTALLAGFGFAAATCCIAPSRGLRTAGAALALGLAVAAGFGARIPFEPARSKHLAMLTVEKHMLPVLHEWTALFRTDLLRASEDTAFTLFDTWGISRNARPETVQWPWGFVVHDGTAGTPLYDLRGEPLAYFDQHVLSLPYWVANPKPRVLVIGVGGGRDVVAALRYGASHVTGVELDPVTLRLIRDDHADIHAGTFSRGDVELLAGEGRHFVRSTDERFDLIQLTGVDTLAATASGAYVLAENYLYTVEAFHDFLDRLTPGGVLSFGIGNWSADAPQAAGRILDVARAALLERGVEDPARHLALVDSTLIFTELLVRNEPFTPEEFAMINERARLLAFVPLLVGDDARPLYRTLVGPDGPEREALLESLPFDVRAIRDDKPFFFHFDRWRDLLRASDFSPVHGTALGQIVLGVLLVSLTLLGAVVIVGPLVVFRRRGVLAAGGAGLGLLGYFLAVGVGFMLFEISLIQRFVVYLGYPTYSLTVVLFALLVFMGIGSHASRRWLGREARALPAAVGLLALLTLALMLGLAPLQQATLAAPLGVRVALTLAALAPLGLVLGVFFPLGIGRASALHPDLVPWAWAINGCASVTATVLAIVLAMEIGFRGVWLCSLLIYAAGVLALLRSGAAGGAAAPAAG